MGKSSMMNMFKKRSTNKDLSPMSVVSKSKSNEDSITEEGAEDSRVAQSTEDLIIDTEQDLRANDSPN